MACNSLPSRLDPTYAHLRTREPPLYQMPHMWQPNLNMPNPYLSSHCDRAQCGWQKWGHDYPDWYARSAASTTPDWYSRRVSDIRSGDMTELMWKPWERTSKPSEKKVYGMVREPSYRPWQRGYQATPHEIDGKIPVPRWGLYHPHYYQEPARCEPLPPLHPDEKHL